MLLNNLCLMNSIFTLIQHCFVKTITKEDGSSHPVIQLETSIGGSIRNFPGRALSVVVDRERFLPVKVAFLVWRLWMMSTFFSCLEHQRFVPSNEPRLLQALHQWWNICASKMLAQEWVSKHRVPIALFWLGIRIACTNTRSSKIFKRSMLIPIMWWCLFWSKCSAKCEFSTIIRVLIFKNICARIWRNLKFLDSYNLHRYLFTFRASISELFRRKKNV